MSKFMKSRRIPLVLEEPKAVQEQVETFSEEVLDGAQTLKSFRLVQDWTVEELAQKVGINASLIEMYESGAQPIPMVFAKRFAEIFHTQYHAFLL